MRVTTFPYKMLNKHRSAIIPGLGHMYSCDKSDDIRIKKEKKKKDSFNTSYKHLMYN